MSTPRAKRALNFGNTPNKRQKAETMIIYRGLKSEMKFRVTPIVHASTTLSATTFNLITQGALAQQRIGNKVKIWRLQVIGATSNSTPCRLDITIPKDAQQTAPPVTTYQTFLHPPTDTTLRTVYLQNGANPNNNGFYVQHKLPMGVVSQFDGAGASDITTNKIRAVFTQPIAGTIEGELRIWYTDV